MYEERRETFSIKDIFLQLLFIVLLVFILIWLFPTKGYLEKRLDGIRDDLKPLYTRLFTDNILTMKESARSYFTTPRLPQNVGDKVTMTLAEMYDKSLLLELIDSNNNACDANKSYVELTQEEDEYELKVTLSCSDKEAYIIEHLGCYDYCEGTICAKKEETKTTSYRYKYVLNVGGTCSGYGSWSAWTTNKIEGNNNTKVETKVEKVLDHYEQKYAVVGYETVKYTVDEPRGYSVSTRTETRAVQKSDYQPYEPVSSGYWKSAGTITSTGNPGGSSTVRYTPTGACTTSTVCNNSCERVTTCTYKKEVWQDTSTRKCPDGGYQPAGDQCVKTWTEYENYTVTDKSCPGGVENSTKTGCIYKVEKTKQVAKYGYVQGDAVYKNVTYYRSATRKCTATKVDYKWSNSDNDATLKAQGYTLTGVKEAI